MLPTSLPRPAKNPPAGNPPLLTAQQRQDLLLWLLLMLLWGIPVFRRGPPTQPGTGNRARNGRIRSTRSRRQVVWIDDVENMEDDGAG